MRHSEIVYLITQTTVADAVGNQTKVDTERKVYANKNDISITEFYNAGVNGMKPEKRFAIKSFEYNGERKLKHENTLYDIIRVSEKGENTVVTCERVIANG